MQHRSLLATTIMMSSSARNIVGATLSSSATTTPFFRRIGSAAAAKNFHHDAFFSRRIFVSSSPESSPSFSLSGLRVRGGGAEGIDGVDPASLSATRGFSSETTTKSEEGGGKAFVKLADPAPGSPFHYAFPVHSLSEAKHFYGTILGCKEGRSSTKWQDYSLHGHQIVCHWVGDDYRCVDYYNPVDGDEVPVPHAGLALTVEEFHELAQRVREAGIKFIIEPHLRFEGMPGEQWTMFFKDPSGNNLEFKAMTKVENLFAKYNVD